MTVAFRRCGDRPPQDVVALPHRGCLGVPLLQSLEPLQRRDKLFATRQVIGLKQTQRLADVLTRELEQCPRDILEVFAAAGHELACRP